MCQQQQKNLFRHVFSPHKMVAPRVKALQDEILCYFLTIIEEEAKPIYYHC